MNLTQQENIALLQCLLEDLADQVGATHQQFRRLTITEVRNALSEARTRLERLQELAQELQSL